ncbi:MAG: hypothetical protein AAB403_05405, partial [Planctomycetota bacterium]
PWDFPRSVGAHSPKNGGADREKRPAAMCKGCAVGPPRGTADETGRTGKREPAPSREPCHWPGAGSGALAPCRYNGFIPEMEPPRVDLKKTVNLPQTEPKIRQARCP